MAAPAWYENSDEKCGLAARFIHSPDLRNRSFELLSELISFRKFTLYRTIFESNRIEKAGLSEADTKKLIVDDKYSLAGLKPIDSSLFNFDDNLQIAEQEWSQKQSRDPFIIFEKKKKGAREVILHRLSVDCADHLSLSMQIKHQINSFRQDSAILADESKKAVFEELVEFTNMLATETELFSHQSIRSLHFLMANGLIRKDAGVQAGFYRVDEVVTDYQTYYPAHQNVPAAMEKFIRNSNALIHSNENPIVKAAKISYDFVAIHPFPDFNGRLSRLIMNMVLWYEGLPFLATLRGNAKEKHRYISSRRRANPAGKNDLSWYQALVAKTVLEGFEQFNAALAKAGIKAVRPAER